MTDTRVNLFTNPAFTATRTPLVVAYNRFSNPVLGNATPQLNWTHNLGGATCTFSVVSSGGVDPTVPFRRMHFDTDSTATGGIGQFVGSTTSNVIPATAGLAYSGSLYLRHNLAAARNFIFYIQGFNASNASTGSGTQTLLVQPNTWTRFQYNNFVAPANTVRLCLVGYTVGSTGIVPAGSDIDMTMPNVDQSIAIQEFFSGASTGPDYVYAWGSTPHASLSTKSAGAVVATNLLTNPGAETAGNGWTANNSAIATADRDTAVKRSGIQSCRGTNVSGTTTLLSISNAGFGAGPSGYNPVTVGRWYTVSAWVYTNETGCSHQIQLRFVDGAFAGVTSVLSTVTAFSAGTWTKVTVSAAAPSGAVYVHVLLFVTKASGVAPGMQAWADDACLQEGAGTDTFNGNTAADSDFVYAWSGVADASTSNKMAKKLVGSNYGNAWPIASTMWSGHDRSDRLWSTYAVGNGSGYTELANNTGGGDSGLTLQRGVTYRASVQVYVDPATPILSAAGPAGLQYSESGFSNTVLDGLSVAFYGERQLSVTFTVSTNVAATAWRLRLANGHILGAVNIWYDNLIIEANPPASPTTYFDGNTIRGNDYAYSWSGTADASTSIAAPLTTGSAPQTLGSGSASVPSATGSSPLTVGSASLASNFTGSAPLSLASRSSAALLSCGSAPLNLVSGSKVQVTGSTPLLLTSGSSAVHFFAKAGSAPLYLGSASSSATAFMGSAPLSLTSGSSSALVAGGSAPLQLASGSAVRVTGDAPLQFESGGSAVHYFAEIGDAPLRLGAGAFSYWVLDPFGLEAFLDPVSGPDVFLDLAPATDVLLDPVATTTVVVDQSSEFEVTVQR